MRGLGARLSAFDVGRQPDYPGRNCGVIGRQTARWRRKACAPGQLVVQPRALLTGVVWTSFVAPKIVEIRDVRRGGDNLSP